MISDSSKLVDVNQVLESHQGPPSDLEGAGSVTSSLQEDPYHYQQDEGSHATGTDSDRRSHTTGGNTSGDGDYIFNNGVGTLSGARCCFLMTLLVAACTLATIVSLIATNNETKDFETQFHHAAVQVIDTSNMNVERVFRSLEVLSLTSTSFIKQQALQDSQKEYPDGFFTLPDSETYFGNARKTTGATLVGYAPDVSNALEHRLWRNYSSKHIGWVEDSFQVTQDEFGYNINQTSADFFNPNTWYLQNVDAQGNVIVIDKETAVTCSAASPSNQVTREVVIQEYPTSGPFAPIWMISPPPNPKTASNLNFDLLQDPTFRLATQVVSKTQSTTFQDICQKTAAWFDQSASGSGKELYSLVVTPAWNSHEASRAFMVGHFFAVVAWETYFLNIFAARDVDPVVVVLESQCSIKTFAYLLIGPNATLLEPDDETLSYSMIRYDNLAQTAPFAYQHDAASLNNEQNDEIVCSSTIFTVTVYPTVDFQQNYSTDKPLFFTSMVLSIFLLTILGFCGFDCLVQRRQTSITKTALRQHALVSSVFPKNIQKQLMEDIDDQAVKNKSGKAGLRTYLNNATVETDETAMAESVKSKPIADLFPETTIMFADIAGFTAWSSTREPSAVFTLLESIYAEFDSIAKRRRVFKVEVVGDCYMAVAGLPDPRTDHAVVMAKFANDCLNRMFRTVRKLELELGPDTAELGLRVGLHSGPVVAGVLRGDKSRFQLFGDTVNTASRMESTGVPGRIQVSEDTAQLLIGSGKGHWLKEREVKIAAKGKGELHTYFLQIDNGAPIAGSSAGTVRSSEGSEDNLVIPDTAEVLERRNRVAEWTVEVMAQQLVSIVEMRKIQGYKPISSTVMSQLEQDSLSDKPESTTVIDEVAECIKLPDYSRVKEKRSSNSDVSEIPLDSAVVFQLKSYVQTVAALYSDNPFHNFDHANHVVMSVNKLLSRINAPDLDEMTAEQIHDHTYGITGDPITWFACVFSALIHDVDHSGVPNAQLVKERAPVATLYNGKSVAEQNSFEIAWDLLMEPTYSDLRKTIYATEEEFKRFRQLVVNSVMATDIVDKDLKTLRNNRWDAAFDESKKETEGRGRILKATIIIEHLIQASDVAHTMQHWHIYRRWNERFFNECYQAYLHGRADQNPAKTWYKGEIAFFDSYIIPLANKLRSCGVFGVSSDEYLSYAMQNRKEWEERGEEMVREMVLNARIEELAVGVRYHRQSDDDLDTGFP